MKSISKNLFLKTLECPVYAWHLYRGLIPKDSSISDEFLVMEAKNIHNMAKLLFKDGIQVSGSFEECLQKTKELVQNKSIRTIFEPVFEYNGFVAKADILHRTENNLWELIEVKSGNKWKNKYISDTAYISLIATKTIPSISKATLYLLSKDFRLGNSIEELFNKVDCSFEVFTKAEDYSILLDTVKDILFAEKPKTKKLKMPCKNCTLFKHCTGEGIEYHIFDLPRLSQLVFEKLCENKIYEIKNLPEDIELTQMQKVVKDCVINDKIYVSPSLKAELEKIVFPCYYLDFESVMTIYPLYNNIAPHTQILTQYSIHKCDKIENITDHFEYIADHKQDCRKQISKKLIEILGTQGSIITYSSAEKQIIDKLALLYPELSEQLRAITDRIVDFEQILRTNYYDKHFHGRTSIKKVLPVMIPQMNYNELEIGEGGVALSAFAYMAMGLYDDEKVKETKQNLLKYCEQDTLALVEMHKFLYEASLNPQF